MKFILTETPIVSDDFIVFEDKNGLILPDEYKNHLLNHNGGVPENQYFNGVEIACFNSLKYGESTLIQDALDMMKDVLPDKFLPIAYDAGDNQICLNLNEGDEYGYVYYLPMDMGDIEPEFMAKSLTDVLSNLTQENDW